MRPKLDTFLSFQLTVRIGLTVSVVTAGCSGSGGSSADSGSVADAAADGPIDNSDGAVADAPRVDDGAPGTVDGSTDQVVTPQCGVLPAAFACTPFDLADLKQGQSTCTLTQVQAFIAACYDSTTATADACSPWFDGDEANTPCGVCLNVWTNGDGYPDVQSCFYLRAGGSDSSRQQRCRTSFQCLIDCSATACSVNLCDDQTQDPNGDTALDRCYESASLFGPTGSCSTEPVTGSTGEVLQTNDECTDAEFKRVTNHCTIAVGKGPIVEQVAAFYAGACTKSANWE